MSIPSDTIGPSSERPDRRRIMHVASGLLVLASAMALAGCAGTTWDLATSPTIPKSMMDRSMPSGGCAGSRELTLSPPRPSVPMAYTLPRALFARPGATLGGVGLRLDIALDHAGYAERGFYCVRGGFALVTKLEKIDPVSKAPLRGAARWRTGAAPLVDWREGVTLGSIIAGLTSRDAGSYRVLAFYVTDQNVTPTSTIPTAAFGTKLIESASDELPANLQMRPYTESHRVRVVIYEFQRKSVTAEPILVNVTRSAQVHLQAAGIWAGLS